VTKPTLIPIERPEKATRGGVNGSQSNFLKETWPISQNPPDAPLFSLDLDYVAIDKLVALGTELGILKSQWKHESDQKSV
jgi:hypothetical protein